MSKYASGIYAIGRSVMISVGAGCFGLVILPAFASAMSGDGHLAGSGVTQMMGVHIMFTLCLVALLFIGYEVWMMSRGNYYGPWMIRIFLTSIFLFIGLWLLAPGLSLFQICLFLALTMVAPVYITIEG